jgi:uncharacterized protein YciW
MDAGAALLYDTAERGGQAMGATTVATPTKAKAKPRTPSAVAELRARVERVENENALLRAALGDLARRFEQAEAEKKAELEDYERREAALYEFADSLGAPPEPDTDDPWEIARLAGQGLTDEEIDTFFGEGD